jgi:hypothetical protein
LLSSILGLCSAGTLQAVLIAAGQIGCFSYLLCSALFPAAGLLGSRSRFPSMEQVALVSVLLQFSIDLVHQ